MNVLIAPCYALETMELQWKTIVYRGGLVTFRIPYAWVEEYEEEGGGTFYADEPNSPTLRLNVLTLKSPSPVNEQTPAQLLGNRSEARGKPVRMLPDGNACLSYSVPANERGVPLIIHRWEIATAVPPNHAHIAIFAFTTLASEQSKISKHLVWLDREINACQLYREPLS